MASAAPSFSSTTETTNYARLCRLLVDVGTQVVRDTFDRIHPPSCLHWILAAKLPTLQSLRKRKILNVTQWGRLFPAISSSVSSASFDITLLMVLLRNICGLSAPASTGSWDILPPASDNSIEANIVRIKYYRNSVYGHASQASVDEPTFHALWLEISNALLALGSAASYTSAISRLKTECMDPDVEEHYRELLKEWKKDDDSTKDKLEQLEEMLKTQGVHTQDKLKEIQESLEQCKAELTCRRHYEGRVAESSLLSIGKVDKIKESFSEEICRAKLEEHYKKTSKVRTSVWCRSSLVDIDQVFTRLCVTQMETTSAGSKQSEMAHYSYLFSPIGNGNNPKRILVQGETGIGKSTFAKRLAIDRARLGNTQTEDKQAAVLGRFKLVVFVNLKEVSKCQSLKDVIYNSKLFAREDKWLVEGLLSYITNHQDEVLLLLDGYDEYHSGQESQIFDIFSGKELRDCCVLITSRISKAGELQEFQDLLAEITGFSEEDKLTYITRQLGDKRDARHLYDHLKENKLKDLAKVPLLLLFFCTLWKKEQSDGFSKSNTNLYSKIVQHVLSHNQGKNTPPRFSRVEDNSEILNQVGKVALECLLNDDHIFPYGKLSSEVLCEESVVIGLLQVTECTESLQPTEMVSFIHKSVQEFLAAWYVTHKCIPDGNLGLIEEHTQTLKSCGEFENVFRFICGLSDDGAAKVFDHLKSVRINDPSLDLSEAMPGEDHKFKPLQEVVMGHLFFGRFVFYCFEEVQSKEELAKLCADCFVGITVLTEPPSYLSLLFSGVISWTFIVGPFEIRSFEIVVSTLYKVAETLNCLDAPMKITENSENVPLGAFLRKFLDVECKECSFTSILHIHDGDLNIYFRDLLLNCAAHVGLFTESAQAATLPCHSANFLPGNSSLKFVQCLCCSGHFAMKDRLHLMNMWTRLVPSITHKSLKILLLLELPMTPAFAAVLGLSLPRWSSLQKLMLTGTGDTSLNVEDMSALFGRIDKEMPLKLLEFSNFSVSGSLTPLTRKLAFFPHLVVLRLECLDLNECDLQDLEKSASDIPNLTNLSLNGNALDHLQKPLTSLLMKLGEIDVFECFDCKLSGETLQILKEALPHIIYYF
ncbi:NACHT, LRR and PYD domains-containing protein 6-like [Montipora foliosa]|uniref:NACHT, LRR and PYD domains-containing protein 6-like n=1 Tax=Montipora foliosa TaxID=591990 RepID=UPI0035F1334C